MYISNKLRFKEYVHLDSVMNEYIQLYKEPV